MRFLCVFDERLLESRRRFGIVVNAVLAAIVAISASVALSHAESLTGNDPTMEKLLSPGAATGQYLQASEELRMRILSLHTQLNRCGTCVDRAALKSELDQAVNQRKTIREGQGAALKSLGLPGNDFEDFLYQRQAGLPDKIAGPQQFDEKYQRTVVNYCLISSKDDAENKACRTKYLDHQTTDDTAEAVKTCYRGLDRDRQTLLHNFPAPDSNPSLIAKHQALWVEFEACVKRTNAFEVMRVATNEACSFQDLSANLNEQDFICACQGFPQSRKSACRPDAIMPAPAVPAFDFQVEPVVRMFNPEGYGPALMGVRLGLPLAAADAEIRKHMNVDAVYDLPIAKHQSFGGGALQSRSNDWPFEIGGRLYVNQDGTEFFAIMMAANLPGRVFQAEHAALVPEGDEATVETGLIGDLGQPDSKLYAGTNPVYIWGGDKEQAERCRPLSIGLRMDDWQVFEGQHTIISRTSPYLREEYPRQYGLYGQMTLLMRTPPRDD
ncbi:MAG: hypothetical protein KGI75_25435, partial [Rhizobiaceae bacterium]|nr:hypothetical protein [Rhizobiaceae bacterium]